MTLKTRLGVRQGDWKCHHAIERIRFPIDVALSCVVSEIFNIKKCHDLEIGVRGHSRSLKVVPFGTVDRIWFPISAF